MVHVFLYLPRWNISPTRDFCYSYDFRRLVLLEVTLSQSTRACKMFVSVDPRYNSWVEMVFQLRVLSIPSSLFCKQKFRQCSRTCSQNAKKSLNSGRNLYIRLYSKNWHCDRHSGPFRYIRTQVRTLFCQWTRINIFRICELGKGRISSYDPRIPVYSYQDEWSAQL